MSKKEKQTTHQNLNSMKQPEKLLKLKFLLKNSKISKTMSSCITTITKDTNLNQSRDKLGQDQLIRKNLSVDLSKDFSLYLAIIAKPLNLLFSIDQFLFEFSKKTYQQKKKGEFYQQLKERKKLSLFYGHLTRKQIVNLFNKVKNHKGYFSKNVFSLLERRLDVVLYRSGITKTIAEARQLIKHKKIQVNQSFVNNSSFLLDSGDVISIIPETVPILIDQLLKSFNTRSTKNPPRIFGDFVSKFKKNWDKYHEKLPTKTKNVSSIHQKFQSKFLCYRVIQGICARMKLRCFYNFNNFKQLRFNNPVIRSQDSLSKISQLSVNSNARSLKRSTKKFGIGEKKNIGIQVKWKIKFKNLLSSKKHSLSKKRNTQQQMFYVNQGSLQKKALLTKKSIVSFFWNRNSISLKNRKIPYIKNFKMGSFQQKDVDSFIYNKGVKEKRFLKTSSAAKNEKNTFFSCQKLKKFLAQAMERKNFYRKSFLFFLKNLENYTKFSHLVYLNSRKFLFKKSVYKKNVFCRKNFNFRVIKPLHIEISYTLLNMIYLYSPQRINFPFYINLDLVKRSLS